MLHSIMRVFSGLWGLIMIGLAVWAAWWAYNDAKSRNMLSWLWAAVSFLFFPLGFFIYLIVRAFNREKNPT